MSGRVANTVPYGSLIKAPKAERSKGRARADVALADWCEARIEKVCTGRAECRHHKLRRSQGGTDDAGNTVDICDACHVFIHHNIAWSFARGWLLRRTA